MASLCWLQMSSGGSEEDLSDLEIQQTLGSLAIGQTDVADRTRGVYAILFIQATMYAIIHNYSTTLIRKS